MTAFKDRTGEVVGKLTLISRAANNPHGHTQWLCRCECGGETVVSTVNLKSVKSCGCLRVLHHQTCTTDWNRWNSMMRRCHRPSDKSFPSYGGRGITVCERWHGAQGFINYMADMGPRPSPRHTVDRIDNNLGYEPGNCRWATPAEQVRNRRDNIWVEHEGERRMLVDWGTALAINEATLRSRFDRGDRGERLLRSVEPRSVQPSISV